MRNLRVASILIAFASLSGPVPARAEPPRPNGRWLEMQSSAALGGPVGLAILNTRDDPTTMPFTVVVRQRLRIPTYSPLGLEASVVLPSGAGVNTVLDLFHTKNVRVHLLDLGVFRTFLRPVSVQRIDRAWDVTAGGGCDIRIAPNGWATADIRVFMPEPLKLITDYGDFARPIVEEAWKGGPVWLGYARTW